ncbi:Cna B-type domain-containing protein, partial [Bacillus cereus]
MHLKRTTSIFSIIMIFMFTIGQSLLPIIANAQELSTTGFVDSITFDKQTLKQGDRATINVTFSDKSGNNMKSGDTLTLTLPRELTGFGGDIPLNDEQGINFGTCKVTAGKVVCTFNDMVEKLHNIRGHFYFTVEANRVEQTTNVETNLGTNLDKQTVTITGSSGGSTGTDPFIGKTGYIQPSNPDEVRWFLRINNKKEYLGRDIVVSDSLQEGQTLNKDSFRIIVNNVEELTIKQFQDQRYGYVQFDDGGRSFKVVINWSMGSARSFNVSYASTIMESGKNQESFKNDYKADYQLLYKQPVSVSGSATVANVTSGGGIQGDLPPKGTLRIVKHLEGNEEKVIQNVSFKLYKESGEQLGDVYKTNEKGIIEISDLQPGKYYVQEISAPEYIDFDSQTKVSFEVKSNEVNGVKLPISNKVKTTSITGTKTWTGDNAADRPKEIKVDLLQNGQVIKTQEVTEASGWKYEFKDLVAYDTDGKVYKYEVKEQPVDGYKSEVKGYDIINTKVVQLTKVEGTKTWKDDNATDRPSAIKVDLLQNGKVIATQEVTAEKDWKYEFKDISVYDANGKAYTYEVKEQSVDGYQSEVKGYDITNTKVGTTVVEGTKTWKDDNATDRPSAIKVDLLQNGKVIATQEVTAEKDWKYEFKDLAVYDANGKAYTYEVKEQPVDGYQSEVKGYDITNTKVPEWTGEDPKDPAKDPNVDPEDPNTNTETNKD